MAQDSGKGLSAMAYLFRIDIRAEIWQAWGMVNKTTLAILAASSDGFGTTIVVIVLVVGLVLAITAIKKRKRISQKKVS